jgi:hypothetical protein
MYRRISEHICSNVVGYVALFVALSGTAYAVDGPLPGQNQVGSTDIIDNDVYSADVRNDSLSGGGLGAVDLASSSVGATEIATSAVGGSEIASSAVNSSEIANSAVNAAEIGEGSIHERPGTPVSIPGGGTPQNGAYDTDDAVAECNGGELLISGAARWSVTSSDAELWIQSIDLDYSSVPEKVFVSGGNDSGTTRSLVAVAYCLGV